MTYEAGGASDRLLEIVDQGVSIPPLPSIALELIKISRCRTDDIDIRKTADLIESDPALTARVLRMANSPFYGAARRITSLAHAITLIGLDDVVSFLNFHLITHMMDRCPQLDRFSPEAFWKHSWATATAARLMGNQKYLVTATPGELYLSGLLHDIGKIVLAIHMQDKFAEALDLAANEQIPLYVAERRIIGVDHALLGAHLLDSWNLPDRILDAVNCHHDPQSADENSQELTGLIEFANCFVKRLGMGDGGAPVLGELDQTWLVRNGVTSLARESGRAAILDEIGAALSQKVGILEEPEEETDESQASDAEAPPPVHIRTHPRVDGAAGRPMRREPWWGRARRKVSSFFQG